MSKSSDRTSKPAKYTNIWAFIKNGQISSVSLLPTLAAILLVVVWTVLKECLFPAVPQFYNYAILSIAGILIGSVGIIYIYRKEMPGPVSSVTVKGGCAVISGLILVLFFWILSIVGFIFALSAR